MKEQFRRTELLFGRDAIEKLQKSHVAVFGVGGVGGYVVEALARSGVGGFLLVDKDTVGLTNINRQIIATHKTLGRPKVQVMKERILDINPAALVETRQIFFLPQKSAGYVSALKWLSGIWEPFFVQFHRTVVLNPPQLLWKHSSFHRVDLFVSRPVFLLS